MTPPPELITETLQALDTLRAKDEGCPGLHNTHHTILVRMTKGFPNGAWEESNALAHLNSRLGEVMVWLTAQGEWYFECSWWEGKADLGFCHPNSDPDRDPTDPLARYKGKTAPRVTDELTAKCELVCAAAGVVAGMDDW
jgi:hypothetical protein